MKNKFMGKACVVVVILTIIFNFSLPVIAAENTSKVIRVACGMNEILYLNSDGDAEGVGLPYLRQLAWNNNWTLEYVEGSYNESLERLYNGEIDLMFPVGEGDDPDGKLAYSAFNAGYQQIGLFARNDADIYYDDFQGFNNKKVGLSIGSNSDLLEDYAEKNGFTYEKVSLNTTKDKTDALTNGDVDMIAFSTLNTVPDGKLVAVIDRVPFYFCTKASNTDIIEGINSGNSSPSNWVWIITDLVKDHF